MAADCLPRITILDEACTGDWVGYVCGYENGGKWSAEEDAEMWMREIYPLFLSFPSVFKMGWREGKRELYSPATCE